MLPASNGLQMEIAIKIFPPQVLRGIIFGLSAVTVDSGILRRMTLNGKMIADNTGSNVIFGSGA